MHGIRFTSCPLLCASLVALVSPPASAVTLHGLKNSQLDDIYGAYAPRGDCSREPKIALDDSGMTFKLGGKSTHSGTVEYALTYGGPEYAGISRWIFPFPVNDDDPGRVLMTFNDNEKSGALKIES
ncbi:MAG: hypothetical protein ACREPP_10970, partial [Rhodanobacteraceae bacterium]